ncbi:GD14049 [Drosophila simulans]|uniref:GD14049 n=1 Tax=Drosophila simulans TaxID=7240 RepID=B4QL01_DROSI|nr:GD14049 [Drosophila simulans]
MTDFSDSSPSGVLSPPTSLIENFHKKNSSPQPLGSSSTISTLTPTTLNGSVVGGGVGGAGHHSIANGRQINTSSSSCSSLKETSHQSTSTSQQVGFDNISIIVQREMRGSHLQ